MILFDTDSPKNIKFDITETANLNLDTAKIFARLKVGKGVEYCILGEIFNNTLSITIPPLKDFISEDLLQENKKYDIIVEVISNDSYLVPYKDDFNIKQKTKMEVKLSEDNNEKALKENIFQIEKKEDFDLSTNITNNESISEKSQKEPIKKEVSIKDKFLNA